MTRVYCRELRCMHNSEFDKGTGVCTCDDIILIGNRMPMCQCACLCPEPADPNQMKFPLPESSDGDQEAAGGD